MTYLSTKKEPGFGTCCSLDLPFVPQYLISFDFLFYFVKFFLQTLGNTDPSGPKICFHYLMFFPTRHQTLKKLMPFGIEFMESS